MQPFEFTAGASITNAGKKINDSANGLFAGGGGPKAPPALSNAVIGMKVGGKVRALLYAVKVVFRPTHTIHP